MNLSYFRFTRVSAFFLAILCAIALLSIGSAPASAQTAAGTIVGVVTDPSGAAVVNAEVKLNDPTTNSSQTTKTNEVGRYNLATVPPGTYEVRASREGFAASVRSGIVVSANNTVRADIQLSVGAVSETVTVSAAGEVLQTDRAEVRQSVDTNQLENLPNSIGRNYQALFVTMPGFDNIRSSYNSTPSNLSVANYKIGLNSGIF